jgi:excinuclease ABC subunit A
VRGARVHNLRNLDVDLPHERLIVLTGISGSGKSSLAFDTIHAEGQRRYIESLSTYARMFLEQLEPPDVDDIEGLPPTIAIDQQARTNSPRSTVATLTEIHDHLRLAFARLGEPHCPSCDQPISRQTPEQMVAGILARPEGQKLLLLAPLVKGRKGRHEEVFERIRREGLIRARVDGQILDVLDQPPRLERTKAHTIEAVVDRLICRAGIGPRLAESVDRALKLSGGSLIILTARDEAWDESVHSVLLACPACEVSVEPFDPRDFSFNSPYGACPSCEGLGFVRDFDREAILALDRSITSGAIDRTPPWGASFDQELAAFMKTWRVRKKARLESWAPESLDALWSGDPASGWRGLRERLTSAWSLATRPKVRSALDELRSSATCPACGGTRLKAASTRVRLLGVRLPELLALDIAAAQALVASWKFEGEDHAIGEPIQRELSERLDALLEVGLDYLTLDRASATLSGGEAQRVKLAGRLGSRQIGVCYVLDEPTAGLHAVDTARLLGTLRRLCSQGNTILVVEHDEMMIREADWLVDLGPGAGPDGGTLVAQGPPDRLEVLGDSATARWLARTEEPVAVHETHATGASGWIEIRGAAEHNLKSIDVSFPLEALTCVTGPSGSGKSTLVFDILARAAQQALRPSGRPAARERIGRHDRITGLERIERVVVVDQSSLGHAARSTPATYIGVLDEIRRLFAKTREARIRGYSAARFSYNAKGGRCETCRGLGVRIVPMQFLPDLEVVCEACRGARYEPATLEIRYHGRNIAETLQLRVDRAIEQFDAVPAVREPLRSLAEAGLGYLQMGQPSATLSGGESQRVKLAAELSRGSSNRTLYLLDEPTTGLHAVDVARLLGLFHRLVDGGGTLVVVEHNLDLIEASDWIIDLGPGGGSSGGRFLAAGPPASIRATAGSVTGAALVSKSRSRP